MSKPIYAEEQVEILEKRLSVLLVYAKQALDHIENGAAIHTNDLRIAIQIAEGRRE